MCIFRIKRFERSLHAFCLGLAVAVILIGCATQPLGTPTGVPGGDSSSSLAITSVVLSEETGAVNVRIGGTHPLTFTSVKQPMPLGVVLYFPNTHLNVAEADLPVAISPVAAIHANQVDSKSNTTRVEIDLASDVPYNVVQDGNTLTYASLDRQWRMKSGMNLRRSPLRRRLR